MELTDDQKRAVEHTGSPLLVSAGPGSGKTTVIAERVKFLIENNHFKPSEILCLTFTIKAAEQMRDKLEEDGVDTSQIKIEHFHSFFHEVLEKNKIYTGLGKAKIVSRATFLVWGLENIDSFNFNHEVRITQNNAAEEIEKIIDGISTFRDELIKPEEIRDFIAKKRSGELPYKDADEVSYVNRLENLAEVFERLEDFKQQQDIIDFDDLILLTHEMLTDPFTKPVLEELQNTYKYILVDEFQDNNFAQFSVVKKLVTDGNITAVGDADQSIFRFQGAYPEIFEDFRLAYPNFTEAFLNENHRSPKSVVDLASEVLAQDTTRQVKNLQAVKTSSEKVGVIGCNTRFDQTEFVKTTIQESMKNNPHLTFKDFAVLSRQQVHGKEVAEALTAAGIPANYVGKSQIHSSPSARTLLAYLRTIAEPSHCIVSVTKILHEHGISELNISKINREAASRAWEKTDGDYVLEVLSDLKNNDPRMTNFTQTDEITEVYDKIKSFIDLSRNTHLSRVIFEIARKRTDIFTKIFKDSFENYVERSVMLDIEKNAQELEYINPKATVKDFLKHIEKLESFEVETEQGIGYTESVQVSTIHQSKGKEFACVFVIDVSPKKLPKSYTAKSYYVPDEIAKGVKPVVDPRTFFENEERRLLYVAMTRAMEKLFITYPTHGSTGRNSNPSKFLTPLNLKKNPSIDFIDFNVVSSKTKILPQPSNPIDIITNEKMDLAIKGVIEGNHKSAIKNIIDLEKISIYKKQKSTDSFDLKQFLAVDIDDTVDKELDGKDIPSIDVTNMRYSKTSFDQYITCPLQFKFARLWKARTAEGDPDGGGGNAMWAGSTFHNVVQRAADPKELNGKHKLQDLENLLEEEWDFRQFIYSSSTDEANTKEDIKKMLAVYQEWNDNNPNKVLGVEIEFNMKIAGKLVNGYIDRLEETPEGEYHIIDYKTGDPKEVPDVQTDIQLNLYSEACRRNCLVGIKLKDNTLPEKAILFFPKKEPGHREYVYNVAANAIIVGEILQKVEDEVIKKVDAKEFPEKPGYHCNGCNFKTVCEFAQIIKKRN